MADVEVKLKIEGDIQKLKVDRGDVVVVSLSDDHAGITVEEAEAVKAKVQGFFPSNKVMVCGPHVKVGVMKEVK